jgi:14-3-3 protein epsilon
MVNYMKNIAFLDRELTPEERNLFSVGYKNVIGAARASWCIVLSVEEREESEGNAANAALTRRYKQKLEEEITTICEDVLDVLDKHLIPSATLGESIVFYAKM